MQRFRESGMGWYCDGLIHYGVVWDAGAYSIGYHNAAQQTGSKFLPKTSPMVQFDKNTAPVLHGNLRMAARSFSITWSFSLTWKFIYYEKSSILTGFVCTPIWPVFHCSVYQYGGGGGRRGWGFFFHVETTASILYRPTLWWGYRTSSDSTVPYLLHSHSLCCHGTLLAIARRHKEQLTADSSNLSWERYLDNRLCRIGLGHLLEFIVSALGKMKVMQIGDVGKPGKRRKKNEM